MSAQQQAQEQVKVVRVGFIGAGEVNFGSDSVEVPWNHARVLALLGSGQRGWGGLPSVGVKVVGVADINAARAEAVAQKWRTKRPSVFGEVKGYGSVQDMLDEAHPEAVIIGLPPFAHGLAQKFNVELECARRGIHLFVEKPISSHPPEQVALVRDELKKLADERSVVVSVGYMFRYAAPVLKLRQLLAEHAQEHPQAPPVRAILLKYNTAYPAIEKAMWYVVASPSCPILHSCVCHYYSMLKRRLGSTHVGGMCGCLVVQSSNNARTLPISRGSSRERSTCPASRPSPSARQQATSRVPATSAVYPTTSSLASAWRRACPTNSAFLV
jgi:predicted dehydrogenase